MSVSRKAQREQARQAARPPKAPRPKDERNAVSEEFRTGAARLSRRIRYALWSSTLGGLLLLRFFYEEVAAFLEAYGLAARVGLIALMLAPALFTYMIGRGQLRDQQTK